MTAYRNSIAPDPSRIGDLLITGGFIKRTELSRALNISHNQGLPLCQVLLRQRRIDRLEKNALLNLQQNLRHGATKERQAREISTKDLGCRLGDLIVADGKLSRAQLDSALEEQKRCRLPLGSILLKTQQITVGRLTSYLRLQQKLLAAAAAAFFAYSAPCHATDPQGSSTAWGSFDVEKPHVSPHSLSANWRRPGLLESVSPRQYAVEDEIFRSKSGKMVLRLTETGVEFRKFF